MPVVCAGCLAKSDIGQIVAGINGFRRGKTTSLPEIPADHLALGELPWFGFLERFGLLLPTRSGQRPPRLERQHATTPKTSPQPVVPTKPLINVREGRLGVNLGGVAAAAAHEEYYLRGYNHRVKKSGPASSSLGVGPSSPQQPAPKTQSAPPI